MGAYSYLREISKSKQSDALRFLARLRTWEYRQTGAMVRLSAPSRVEKARALGYRRKPGYVVYRVRVKRGGRKKPLKKGINFGKPRNAGIRMPVQRNHQVLGELRVQRKCPNLVVLNSYWIAMDPKYKYYEVILVDSFHEAIRSDPRINWIAKAKHQKRVYHGKTSAGRKHRGLRSKGIGASKIRPSVNANWKRRNTQKFHRRR
eukprot:CAMPEP_0117450208 /NCGR_PEP_ID=MMETSP0759-20121206/8347_1 /TAXON_ID=63605 /ORGANISM="Percolomonas cosmopolitus, Strain WS" /LENGTH=203 /DNA_ID=CAMNT_0005242717 /DNA_START=83 /DNA_END=694 /DNA_ORIENTATION=-